MSNTENKHNQTFILLDVHGSSGKKIHFFSILVTCLFIYIFFAHRGDILFISDEFKTVGDLRITLANWGLLVVFCYFMIFGNLLISRMRTKLDSYGISRKIDMPKGFGFNYFVQEWSFSWNEIKSVDWSLTRSGRPAGFGSLLQLIFKNGQSKSIMPYRWVNKNSKPERNNVQDLWLILKFALNQKKAKNIIRESLEGGELVTAVKLARPDLDLSLNNTKNIDQSKIDNSSLELGVAFSLICSIIYFWVEVFFTLNEFYAGTTPYVAFFAVGFVAFLLCSKIFKWFQPKSKTNHIYSLFFAIAIGFTSYPLALRINQIGGSTEDYTYILDNKLVWQPVDVDSNLPRLNIYLSSSDWWKKFTQGDEYIFQLRKGALNFWQINMEKIYTSQKGNNSGLD